LRGQGTFEDQELVTVIIPVRNEAASISGCVSSVRTQDWMNLQIIVIDGDSNDDTVSIVSALAEEDPRILLLNNPRRIIPVSLNMALAQAQARWLVRIDAHAKIPSDYVAIAVHHLREGKYGGVGGRKDGVGRTPAGRAIAKAMASRFGVGDSTYHWGTRVQLVEHVPFGAYPTHVLRELGGWDETMIVNQDFELDYRLRLSGRTILFDPSMRIEWECRQSIGDLIRQYRRYGGGKVMVARKHPISLRLRHLAAPALVAQVTVAILTFRRFPRLSTIACVPYLLALCVASVDTARETEPDARKYVAPAYLAMHFGWGVGFWERLIRLMVRRA